MDKHFSSRPHKSSKWSHEHQKMILSLASAESRKKKLEDNIRNLRDMQKDLENDLLQCEDDIHRLKKTTRNMTGSQQPSRKLDKTRLFIDKMDFATTDRELEHHFEKYGDILTAYIIRYPLTKFSRGFGYVEFTHDYMAENAMANAPHNLNGRIIETRYAYENPVKSYKHGNRGKPY